MCNALWERDKEGKAYVAAFLTAAWSFVQRALFAGIGSVLFSMCVGVCACVGV
jgi:hypothetical protein